MLTEGWFLLYSLDQAFFQDVKFKLGGIYGRNGFRLRMSVLSHGRCVY